MSAAPAALTSTANAKGLIFLDSSDMIIRDTVTPRIMDGLRERCNVLFSDFDDVHYKISAESESPNILKISIALRDAVKIKSNGGKDAIDRCFPGMEVSKEQDFDITLQMDCDRITLDKAKLVQDLCELKKVVCGGPIEKALTSLMKKETPGPVLQFNYRKNESYFICPSGGKVVVVFLVDFADQTDKAMAKVFLQEFVEAQRTVRTAPPVQYLREAPGELAGLGLKYPADIAGFISFALEERHVQGSKLNTAVTLLTGFRSYLLYHIKCSKTYLHMRMRKRVAGWMQVLNRALPEVETEKKTAAGKTFTRK